MKRVGKNFVFLIMFIIVGLFSLSLMKKTNPDEITNADSNIVSGVIETNETDVNVLETNYNSQRQKHIE